MLGGASASRGRSHCRIVSVCFARHVRKRSPKTADPSTKSVIGKKTAVKNSRKSQKLLEVGVCLFGIGADAKLFVGTRAHSHTQRHGKHTHTHTHTLCILSSPASLSPVVARMTQHNNSRQQLLPEPTRVIHTVGSHRFYR